MNKTFIYFSKLPEEFDLETIKELSFFHPNFSQNSQTEEKWIEQPICYRYKQIFKDFKSNYGVRKIDDPSCLKQAYVGIKEDTTFVQISSFAQKLEKKFGIHMFQAYRHLVPGYEINKKIFYQDTAHLIFDCADEAGNTISLNKDDLSSIYTILAMSLNMERGGFTKDPDYLKYIQSKEKERDNRLFAFKKKMEEFKGLPDNNEPETLILKEKIYHEILELKESLF